MLKWIGGGCLLIIVIIGIVAYAGYRKMSDMAEAGPSVTVSIAASPERVFASLANADSLGTWRASETAPRSSRRGMLVPGDTIIEAAPDSNRAEIGAWIVDSVIPNQLITMHSVPSRNARLSATRRDSLAAAGDSTRVTSTLDIAVTAPGDAGAKMPGAAAKMMVAAARMASQVELDKLKRRIEARAAARPDSAR